MMGQARGGEEEDKALRCMILQFQFELIKMVCDRLPYLCARVTEKHASRSASNIPWSAGQTWPADLIQLARKGMLSALILLLMSTKQRVSFICLIIDVIYEILRSTNFIIHSNC